MYKQTANLTISANLSKTDMTILDIILLLCFVPAVVAGISKGFVSQVVQIAALILGAWAAFHFSSVICDWLSQYLTMDGTMLKIIAFILVIIVIKQIESFCISIDDIHEFSFISLGKMSNHPGLQLDCLSLSLQ